MVKFRELALRGLLFVSIVLPVMSFPEPARASVIDMAPQMVNGVEVFVAQLAQTTTAGGALTAAGNTCLTSAETLALAEEGVTIAARTPQGWSVGAAFGLGYGLGSLALWAWDQGHPSERGAEGFVTDPYYPGELMVSGSWDMAKNGWVCKGGPRTSLEWVDQYFSYANRDWKDMWCYTGDHTLMFGGWNYTWPDGNHNSTIISQDGGTIGNPPTTTILVAPNERAGFNGALIHPDGSGYQALNGFLFGPWGYNPDYPTHAEPHDSLSMFQSGSDIAAAGKKLITDKIAANPPVTPPARPTKGLVIAQKPGTDGSKPSDWEVKPAAESSFNPDSDPGTPDGNPTPGPSVSPSDNPSGDPSGNPSTDPSTSPSPSTEQIPELPSFDCEFFITHFLNGAKSKFPFDLLTGAFTAQDADLYMVFFDVKTDLNFIKPIFHGFEVIGLIGLIVASITLI